MIWRARQRRSKQIIRICLRSDVGVSQRRLCWLRLLNDRRVKGAVAGVGLGLAIGFHGRCIRARLDQNHLQNRER